jgi:hypothetical protein
MTAMTRRWPGRWGDLGNVHYVVDRFQVREREMAGAAMGGGVLRPLVDCVVPLQIWRRKPVREERQRKIREGEGIEGAGKLHCTEIGENWLLPCRDPVRNFAAAWRRFCGRSEGKERGRRGLFKGAGSGKKLPGNNSNWRGGVTGLGAWSSACVSAGGRRRWRGLTRGTRESVRGEGEAVPIRVRLVGLWAGF